MTRLQFRCTLLSDVILNVKSASEGNNKTLDFIPGNNFLGMVASALYAKCTEEKALDLFHNGCVRYGDAHLAIGKMRTVKIPAAMYYEKGTRVADATYIYNVYSREYDTKKMQLKQCRSGFYTFTIENEHPIGKGIKAKTSFAIKSAYDKVNRRSKDNQMFGYESLTSGQQFYFAVETDKDEYVEEIRNALVGTRHLGRSRTAQYGLVKIEVYGYKEIESDFNKEGEITVYADGRLIFLDEDGLPTFQPTTEQLGIRGGEIVWEKSQIRTFRYAPWNGRRRAYDTDRCGIEKGSVFVVKGGSITNTGNEAIGHYKNEGFGAVIYNPCFLVVEADSNGKALYKLEETVDGRLPEQETVAKRLPKQEYEQNKPSVETAKTESPLLEYLEVQAKEQKHINEIYRKVNEFVKTNGSKFTSAAFASQWGAIRSMVMAASTKEEAETNIYEYLSHGVAKDKWEDGGRSEVFQNFCESAYDTYDDTFFKQALINLASQMAKLKGKEDRR